MSQAVSPYTQKLYSEAAEALRPSRPQSWIGRSISAINLSCKAHTEAVCQLARSVFHGAFSLVSSTSKESCSEALAQSSSAYGLWWETFKVALGGKVSGKILSARQNGRLPPSEDPLLYAHIDSPSALSSPKIKPASSSLYGLPPYEENLLKIQAERRERALLQSAWSVSVQDEDLVDLDLELARAKAEQVFLLRSSLALVPEQHELSLEPVFAGNGAIPAVLSSWSLGPNRLLRPSFVSRTVEFEVPGLPEQTADLFAVFDPFQGSRAAEFLAQRLPLVLSEELSRFCKEGFSKAAMTACLKSACAALHKQYLAHASHLNAHGDYPAELPLFSAQGATGTIVLIVGNAIWTASTGNSRALLFTQDKKTGFTAMEPLSTPSSPDLDLLSDHAVPDARGFGFEQFKGGISPEPYVTCASLEEPSIFLLGSQDLFNFCTPEKVAAAIGRQSLAIRSSKPLQALEEVSFAVTQTFFTNQPTIQALPSFLLCALSTGKKSDISQNPALHVTMTEEELAALEKELEDEPAETPSAPKTPLEASFTLLSDSKENGSEARSTASGASQEKEDSHHSFVLVEEPDGSDFVTDLWGASDRWGKD